MGEVRPVQDNDKGVVRKGTRECYDEGLSTLGETGKENQLREHYKTSIHVMHYQYWNTCVAVVMRVSVVTEAHLSGAVLRFEGGNSQLVHWISIW